MGGLSKHMMHPHENFDLTVSQLAEMITNSFNGKMRFVEKVDGINIHIFKKNGEIRFARNSKDLDVGGMGYVDIAERWKNKPEVAEKFLKGYRMMMEYDKAPEFEIPNFEETKVTLNCEIVLAGRTNVMYYPKDTIVPHNYWHWDVVDGKWANIDVRSLHTDALESIVPTIQANNFVIESTLLEKLIPLDYSIDSQFSLMTLREMYQLRYWSYITNKYDGEVDGSVIKYMFNRMFKDGDQENLRTLRSAEPHFVQWILDNEKSVKEYVLGPIKNLIIHYGNDILRNISYGYLNSTTPENTIKLRNDLINSHKLDSIGFLGYQINPVEGVVFKYKGQIYKWTGSFAVINKVLWEK